MDVRATAERVSDRLGPTRERVSERFEDAGGRLREAVGAAPHVADRVTEDLSEASREVAGRLSETSRETAGRVERYLDDRFGEGTVSTWGPRLAFAFAGLVVGFLLGWAARRRARSPEDEEDRHGAFTPAPRTPARAGEGPVRAVPGS